jgi:hypothetical protein
MQQTSRTRRLSAQVALTGVAPVAVVNRVAARRAAAAGVAPKCCGLTRGRQRTSKRLRCLCVK